MEVRSIFTNYRRGNRLCLDGPLPGPDRMTLGTGKETALYLQQWEKCSSDNASTLTSVSRRVSEQIWDKAVLLPLRSILCLLHRDLVYM